MTGSQYAEIHNGTFHDGYKELAQPGDVAMPYDKSVVSGSVVDGEKKGDRVEGEDEEYVRQFNGHKTWLDETR